MSSSTLKVDKERVYYKKDGVVIIDKRTDDLTPAERDIVRKECVTFYRILLIAGLLMIVAGLIIVFIVPEDIASDTSRGNSLYSLALIFIILGPLFFIGSILYKRTMPVPWVFGESKIDM